jgi:hypothetical protein
VKIRRQIRLWRIPPPPMWEPPEKPRALVMPALLKPLPVCMEPLVVERPLRVAAVVVDVVALRPVV